VPRLSADDRKAELIDAAARAIAQHGVAGATTRVIAAEAGAPQATLHYCFGSKEDLLLELVKRATESMVKVCVVEPGLGLGPTAGAVLRKHAEWLKIDPDLALSTYDLYLWALPTRQDLADHEIKHNHELLQATLRAGLRPTDDPDIVEEIARMTFAIMDGVALQWFLHHDEDRLARDLENGARALALLASGHGLKGRPRVRSRRA
jgi:AcrR family transcriptional regulator